MGTARRRPGQGEVISSCPDCGAWGVMYSRCCRGCYDFRRRHAHAPCGGCGLTLPVKHDYCRACWLQAALQAEDPPAVTAADLAGVRHHQLFFAGMNKMRGPRSGVRQRAALRAAAPPQAPAQPVRDADGGQLQMHLPGPARAFDYGLHAEPGNPCLVRARQVAATLAETRGWKTELAAELDRALVICLSGHAETVRFTHAELVAILHRYGPSITRVADILERIGLYHDDQPAALDNWCEDKLADLAPGIAADARSWVRQLRHGGPRSRPRADDTVRVYLRSAHPVLAEWSTRYDHLREITRADVVTAVTAVTGYRRRQRTVALRSLLRHCKASRTIFANPAAGIRTSHCEAESVIIPLTTAAIDEATAAASTPPPGSP